ncbi:MAG: heterodisulfide reductase-related iron-sulfur binding cluster [Syntrophobacteraceae bacterium]|nr:heterodisulfide reductase-related iron-sulfur binding cluster [Syntrophobacteraceae bacterium]
MDQEELSKLEARCIQEQPAACVAACPVHVDARAMAAAIAKGDFASAAKIFKKSVPFPGIVSRICDHPCQAVCKRDEAGEAVSVRALEKSCLDWAAKTSDSFFLPPAKATRIAIAGGGLSGLTAAFDLAKKGYTVEVFEKESRLGGSLFHLSREQLPEEVIAADLQALEKVGVTIRTNVGVGQDISLEKLCRDFDAVYLASGEQPEGGLSLGVDGAGQWIIDPLTLATTNPKVFAGGSLRRLPQNRSPIESIADGRRGAVSIDRFLQKVSLSASRTGEGSQKTRLFTSLEGIEPLPVVAMSSGATGYSKEEAILEAKRCIQCQCLECVKVCEYLNSFKSYPKKYVRRIYNNLSIVMGHRHANKLINSCSLCGLCKEVCPEDLNMAMVCHAAREIMVDSGRMPPSVHEFPIRDMLFSNSEKFALTRPQPGSSASTHLFFPGCQLSASSPDHVRKTYDFLCENLDGGVALMLRCCGAPAQWSGRAELFSDSFKNIVSQWEQMDRPRIILACSTCYEVFKTHLPQASIVSLWEVFDRSALPRVARDSSAPVRRLAIHDACSTRHEKNIHDSVRNILQKLGLEIEELALSGEKTECCGYGGLMFFANPELARSVITRRIGQSECDYLAYCAMCRDYLASAGKRTWHLLDFLFGPPPDDFARRKGPGYSVRRENRARLKNALLEELWGDTPVGKEKYGMIRLKISEELRETLERRQILDSDIRQVIDFAESSGTRLFNSRTSHYLAHWKPAALTYWVEYAPSEGEFTVFNAYCHRMELTEGVRS